MSKLLWFVKDEILSNRSLYGDGLDLRRCGARTGETSQPPAATHDQRQIRPCPKSRIKGRSEADTIPDNHLSDLARVPFKLEKLMFFALILCFDGLLHDITFMPFQALLGIFRISRRLLTGTKGFLPVPTTPQVSRFRFVSSCEHFLFSEQELFIIQSDTPTLKQDPNQRQQQSPYQLTAIFPGLSYVLPLDCCCSSFPS